MNKTEFLKKYGQDKKSKFDRWTLRLFNLDHDSKTEELRSKVAVEYNSIKLNGGELFEDKIVPMDESDISDIQRRKKKTLKIITIFAITIPLPFVMIFFYAGSPASDEMILVVFSGLCFIVTIAGSYWITIRNYNKILRSKSKRIVKGVITDRIQTEEEGPAFEISFKEMIFVSTTDYKNFIPGDIISIITFSELDTSVKRYVSKLGNIFNR